MKARRLSEVARAIEGTVLGDDVVVSSVATHSAHVEPGALFVALPGQRADGADFLGDAFERGAAAAMVKEGTAVPGPAVAARSAGDGLLALAADERRSLDVRVVGITGANGKTSTKDLAASVLGPHVRVHVSPRSFNNEIGVPLTLLSVPDDTEVVVAELGARHVGDVSLLCEVASPDVVVVTNVGLAHIEVFGSWEAIVEAAREPIDALPRGGVAILNADDAVAAALSPGSGRRTITFGVGPDADVRGERIELDPSGRASFDLVEGGRRERVELAVPGEHMVANALAAAACGMVLGLGITECAAGLKGALVSPWRMETFDGANGLRIVNDAYNANPESMAAAIKTARWIAGSGRLIAVLGTMAELGAISQEQHDRIGEVAARVRVDRLIVVGGEAGPIATAAIREGMATGDVVTYEEIADAIDDVRANAEPGDTVLCKASRVVGLERVAEALR